MPFVVQKEAAIVKPVNDPKVAGLTVKFTTKAVPVLLDDTVTLDAAAAGPCGVTVVSADSGPTQPGP